MLVCAIGFAQEEQTWTDSEGNVWKFEITDDVNHYVTLRGLESGENATVPAIVKVEGTDYYVREIGGNAFGFNSNIIAVSDQPYCVKIGGSAFRGCLNLSVVGDLSACQDIEGGAFTENPTLSIVGDLSACQRIGDLAFRQCVNLSRVGSLSACQSVGYESFHECYKLSLIGDMPMCQSIGIEAFRSCWNLSSIGDLSACKSIGADAFNSCSNLYSIGSISACQSIGKRAFSGCSKLSGTVNLSACQSIGEGTFKDCKYLSTITINADVVPTIETDVISNTTTVLVKGSMFDAFKNADAWSTYANRIVSMDAQREYDINVVPPTIGSSIYDIIGEENLGNVMSLKLSGEMNGYDIFIIRNYMPNLHSIDMSNVKIVAASDNFNYYDTFYTENDVFPSHAFCDKCNIASVILPNSITKIGSHSLANIAIQEVVIPETVTTIESDAFSGSILRNVTLPEGLKSLGDGTFIGCDIRTIDLPSSLESIGGGCFSGSYNLKSIVLPPALTSIGDGAFQGTGITSVYATALNPTTVHMGMNSFADYENTTLYIPIDEETGWKTTYYAYYWDTYWSQFSKKLGWTPKYTDVTINADYEQDKGTIPSENDVNIDGQIGTNGGYIVGAGASQELGNVTVEQDDEKGGSIIGEGNDNLSIKSLKCNIKITPNKWYFFCFPFDVDWTEIDYADASYIWHKYDGSERAQGNGGWKKLQGNVDDKILHAGEGYIFQANHPFTLTIQCKNPDMAAADKAKELTTYVSSNPENASWNLIGNPFLSYYNMDDMGNSSNDAQYSAPVTVYDGNNYQALRPGDDDYQFHPFQAFFVQKPAGETALTFGSEGRETYTQSVEVQANAKLRRAMVRKNSDRQIINLTISDGENADKTRVVFNEAKSMSYEAECDASKFFTTEAVPQIYSVCNGVSYSINERPGAEGCVDLGVRISKDGVYTIEAARMDTPMLLIDHETGTTTDMSEGAYCFTAKAGTYADRFSMVKAENVTAIASIKADADNSSVYDLGGRKVTMPQRGVVIKANKKVLMK